MKIIFKTMILMAAAMAAISCGTRQVRYETRAERILVNVDHASDYYDEILELTEELGVTGQMLMKGKKSIDQVKEDMAGHENNLLYMPIIDIYKPQGKALFMEYQERGVVPMAYEVCYRELNDEAAFDSPDPYAVYRKYVDMGVKMIQTDRPQLVIGFLRSRGLHD